MLLICFTMFVIFNVIKWADLPIQIGDTQIIIFVIIGLYITATIKELFKRSAKEIYEKFKDRESEGDFLLPVELTDCFGDFGIILIIIFGLASIFFMYYVIRDGSLKYLIISVLTLIISEICLFLGGYKRIKRKAIPAILYLEANALNRAIILLAAIIVIFIIVSLQMLFVVIFLIGILGNSIGGE